MSPNGHATLPEGLFASLWCERGRSCDGGRVPSHDPASPPAPVLLADLEPMARVGMLGMLADAGAEVVTAAAGADLAETVRRVQPYVVVLDLDGAEPRELTQTVRRARPETKVVLWARREDVMEVLDPGATVPRFVLGSNPDELCAELVLTRTTRPEAN
jgi:DNA-binding NarL/FixJ family response regulator